MASYTARKFPGLRTLCILLRPFPRCTAPSPNVCASFPAVFPSSLPESSRLSPRSLNASPLFAARCFCSHPSNLVDESQAPAPIDYRSMLQEDEFHNLADSTIHNLLEKLEEYGDSVDMDGFDIDYGNEVLTLKLGSLGTYVMNKQTPNRQIWLSSPVSGPSRFDWDASTQAWVYRRNKEHLLLVLETELEELCGKRVNLS